MNGLQNLERRVTMEHKCEGVRGNSVSYTRWALFDGKYTKEEILDYAYDMDWNIFACNSGPGMAFQHGPSVMHQGSKALLYIEGGLDI